MPKRPRRAKALGLRHSTFLRHWSLGIRHSFRHIGNNDCGEENIHERDFEKEDPTEAHELVVTKPRQSPADPNEEEEEERNLPEEDEDIEETADHPVPSA